MSVTLDVIQQATAQIEGVDDQVAALVGGLTDERRRTVTRPPAAFPTRARAVLHEARRLSDTSAFAGVDPAEIEACLDRVEALDPAINAVERLLRRLQDARLEAMHDSWTATLDLYAVAQARSRNNQSCRSIVEIMAPLFARSSRSRTTAEKTGAGAEPAK